MKPRSAGEFKRYVSQRAVRHPAHFPKVIRHGRAGAPRMGKVANVFQHSGRVHQFRPERFQFAFMRQRFVACRAQRPALGWRVCGGIQRVLIASSSPGRLSALAANFNVHFSLRSPGET